MALGNPRRWALSALTGAIGIVALSGCAVFKVEPTASQSGVIGPVSISFSVCASQPASPPAGSCTNKGNSTQDAASHPSQVFVGFRVPAGTGAPTSFTSSSTGPSNGGPTLSFTPSAGYTSELQRLDPAPSGQQWAGYVSQYVSYDKEKGEQNFTASAAFTPPTQSNGAPFVGPFTYRVVVGGRQFSSSEGVPDVNEPIDCGASLTTYSSFNSICVDAPAPGKGAGQLDSTESLEIRDAGIVPGATVSVVAGATATLPFSFQYAGAPSAGLGFSLSASTGVPAGTASPTPATVSPGAAGSTPVEVSVAIPAATTPGTYTVTLSASLSNGETRSGVSQLTVTAPPAPPAPAAVPIVTPALAKCIVPRLTGQTQAASTTSLKKAGCKLGKLTKRHSKVKKGRVIAQSPAAGMSVTSGAAVSVVLSEGQTPRRHKSKTTKH